MREGDPTGLATAPRPPLAKRKVSSAYRQREEISRNVHTRRRTPTPTAGSRASFDANSEASYADGVRSVRGLTRPLTYPYYLSVLM